jgi:hypothetical protein
MIVPDQLYGVGRKALSGGLLELWTCRVAQSTNLATISSALPNIPLDRLLVLSHCFGVWTPGAAQTFVKARLDDVDANGVIVGPVWGGPFTLGGAAADDWVRNPQPLPGYVVSFGHRLQLTSDFNAGAAFNAVSFTVQGWLIPKGEVQFAGTAN